MHGMKSDEHRYKLMGESFPYTVRIRVQAIQANVFYSKGLFAEAR